MRDLSASSPKIRPCRMLTLVSGVGPMGPGPLSAAGASATASIAGGVVVAGGVVAAGGVTTALGAGCTAAWATTVWPETATILPEGAGWVFCSAGPDDVTVGKT